MSTQDESSRVRDELSALRRRVAELEERERQLRALMDNSPQGMIVHDERILYCNAAAVQLFGYATREELAALPQAEQLFAEEARDWIRAQRRRRLANEAVPTAFEVSALRKDGAPLTLQVHAQRVDWDGVPAVQCTYTDLTDRRRAEEALRDSQRLLRAVLDSLPHWLVVKDLQGRYLLSNRAMAESLGTTPDALEGRTSAENRARDVAEPGLVEQTDREVLEHGRTVDLPAYAVHLPDGTHQMRRMLKVPLRDEAERVVGLVGLAMDVTRRHEAEARLRDSEARLRSLVAHLPLILCTCDRDGVITALEGGGLADVDFGPEGSVGRPMTVLLRENSPAPEHVRRALAGEDVQAVWHYRSRTYDMRLTPMRDDAGHVAGVIVLGLDITRRVEAEREREAGRRLLQNVVDTIPHNVFVKDSEGRYLLVNRAFTECFGVRPEQVLGHEIGTVSVATPEEREHWRALDREVLTTGRRVDTPGAPSTLPDGSRHVFRSIRMPLRDEHGALIGLVGVGEDITEQRRSDAELRSQRRLLQNVMDTIPHYVYVKDRQSRYLMVNRAMADLWGVPEEELVGVEPERLPVATDEQRRSFVSKDEAVWRTGGRVDDPEFAATLPDGSTRTFRSVKMPMRDDAGEIFGLVGVAEDITEQRRAQEELSAQRRLLQAVFDAIPTWLVVKDRDSRYMMVNNLMAAELGRTPEDFRGLAHDQVPHGTAAERAKFRRDDERVVTEGRPLEREEELTLPDGRLTHRHVRKVPLRDEHGEIVGIVGISEDVTARRTMEEQLRRMQRMEAIGTLAGGIAHDFNNVLFPIIGFSELTLRELDAGSTAHHNLTIVRESALRARDIVSQILTFSRRSDSQRELIQLAPLVREALRFLHSTLPRSVEVEDAVAADVGHVNADAVQMHQVLMNLCVNAAHAMPEGGTLTVRLYNAVLDDEVGHTGERLCGPAVCLEVTDTGTGMTPATLAHIFEPFYTTKSVGEGSGLGLSTALGIVSQHGGIITVQSAPGRGSTFRVCLPREEPLRSNGAADAAHAPAPGEASILFVDDEWAITELATRVLEELGYQVTAFTSSTKALAAFRAEPHAFDLIVTDQMMPELTGDKLAAEAHAVRGDIPILLGTGFSELISPERAASLGVTDVFYKPISPDRLATLVHKTLSAARPAAAASGPEPAADA